MASRRTGGRLIGVDGRGRLDRLGVRLRARCAWRRRSRPRGALAAEPWPGGLRVSARFGLHTGEAERRGADYFGPTVNLAARVRGAGRRRADLPLAGDGGARGSATFRPAARSSTSGRIASPAWPRRSASRREGSGVPAPPAAECPYRGLLAFEPEDRAFFFGREDVVGELVGRLAPGRLLAVVGASGSGKSSVLRAGVIAAVRAGEVPAFRRARLLTPGSHPEPLERR